MISEMNEPVERNSIEDIPALASLEKFPVHWMKVCPSFLPVVIGKQRMVLKTEEYSSSGWAEMTEKVM